MVALLAGLAPLPNLGSDRPSSDKQATASAEATAKPGAESHDPIATLQQQMALQQKQIEQLQKALVEQEQILEQMLRAAKPAAAAEQAAPPQSPNLGVVASAVPMVPAAPKTPGPALSPIPNPGAAPVTQDQMEGYTKKLDAVSKSMEALNKGLAGFKLSGDVRLRSDNIFRSSTAVAGPAQNVRARYRVRVNVDKKLSDQIDTHVQLGSGTFNNPLTLDTDFSGANTRGALFITEAWGDFHPNKYVSLRGGKMSGVFADSEQFLLDDDVRFNGFQEIFKTKPSASSSLGKVVFEFRAGQYIMTNPNVQVLPTSAQCASSSPPANCPYLSAGFTPGQKVPATDMFDQGIALTATSDKWGQQVSFDAQLWRNPNSLQLATTSSGYPLLVNGYYGLALSGGITGSGNGTTTKGGAILTAANFRIAKVSYRVDYKGLKSSRQNFPVYFTAQAAQNFGASFYNDAFEGALNIGETKKAGDVLFKYAFYYKQANSMISQVTDDDVGTGTGVNLRTHAFRLDLGLNKWMVWQNRIYIQNELAGNDPARSFFVPLQRGTGTQYRYQSQLQFTF
jgi:hypothetical protein